ncbi:hypothetical protein HYU95_05690 [Candidatus Daviesbacteria bacterium]|nr:hypothetical protein [Candidatus Daviesbacteria bacterium]
MQQTHRTQIYLPADLRREIDRDRREEKESLAQYLRKAAEERLARRKRRRADLKRLANDFIGSSKMSRKEANQWIDEIREDRRLSDERLDKRWDEALKKGSKKK